jgi:hypothetical protein
MFVYTDELRFNNSRYLYETIIKLKPVDRDSYDPYGERTVKLRCLHEKTFEVESITE